MDIERGRMGKSSHDHERRIAVLEKQLAQLRYDTAPLIVGAKELIDQGRVGEGGMLWISADDLKRLAANHPKAESK